MSVVGKKSHKSALVIEKLDYEGRDMLFDKPHCSLFFCCYFRIKEYKKPQNRECIQEVILISSGENARGFSNKGTEDSGRALQIP